jgi:acyl carrier protein
MEEKIKSTMASIFKCDISEIDENASPDTIKNWDSLRHMNLIVALEEEFGVTFKEDEIVEMLNYKLIYETLTAKI